MIDPDSIVREQVAALDWDCRYAPQPVIKGVLELSGVWLTMNVLMLDPKRVLVEATQEPLMEMLDAWGFTPVPCPCATLDIRRRGELRSYWK